MSGWQNLIINSTPSGFSIVHEDGDILGIYPTIDDANTFVAGYKYAEEKLIPKLTQVIALAMK